MKQIAALKKNVLHGLIGSTKPLRGFPGTVAAAQLRYYGMNVSVGDFVFRDSVAARVAACASDHSRYFVIVEVWLPVGLFASEQLWQRLDQGDVQAWPAEEIEQAIAWYDTGDGWVVFKLEHALH